MKVISKMSAALVILRLRKSKGLSSPSISSCQQPITCRPRNYIIPPEATTSATTRRLAAARLFAPLIIAIAAPHPAVAFDNGIPDMKLYKNKTKHPETQPLLGLKSNGKLETCDDDLNCFSTSGDEAHLLEMWKPKAGSKDNDAMGELLETIEAYPPGQAKVDKGGFSIIQASSDYLYVQFESMKHGFIDDVEFAVSSSNGGKGRQVQVQVRSSSRIGKLDLGVNAKRLNWISAQLREKGWTAPAITKEDYPDYFGTLVFTYDDYIRSVLSPLDCPVPALPLSCKDPSPPGAT